jgi:putative ABC transport system permease protein
MRFWRLLRQSFTALGRNKLRTFLVMLGIIVGIAALTVIVGISKAASRKVMAQINNFGPTALMVFAGGGRNVPGGDASVATLTLEDARAIEEQVPGVRMTCAQVNRSRIPVTHGDRSAEVGVMGVAITYSEAWDWPVVAGEFFDEQDSAAMARAAVIGQSAARELFGEASPLGETVRIANANFQIKGVLQAKGTGPTGGDMDNRIVIPLSTAMRRTFNVTSLTVVRVRVDRSSNVRQVEEEIRTLLRERHRIPPADLDDFRVVSPGIIADLAESAAGTLDKVLIALTSLSLLVGGVVLMNVMLLSVTERRHEIGLRRALGARKSDVMWQFLFEALALTSAGGLAGIVLGGVVSVIIARLGWQPAEMSWKPLVLGMLICWVVGLIFGLLPARRASKLHPVEALR